MYLGKLSLTYQYTILFQNYNLSYIFIGNYKIAVLYIIVGTVIVIYLLYYIISCRYLITIFQNLSLYNLCPTGQAMCFKWVPTIMSKIWFM